MLGLVLVPFVVSAGVLLIRVGASFHAGLDNGQNELHTRDVGHHLVLLGPYSRDGWNHLGPAMYYLLALPYRLTGSHSVGMYVGALLINAVAVAGIVVIAWRRAGLPVLLLSVFGVTVVMQNLGADFLRDPWNPYVTVLPFGLLMFLVWELSVGRPWALPAAAAVATFLVQTHVGYLPLALPLLVGGAVWLVIVARRRATEGAAGAAEWSNVVRAGLLSGVVLVVMWTPPLIGVILQTPGNLGTAVRYFVNGKAHHSLLDGYRIVAEQFSARAEWITGAHTPNPFSGEPDFLLRTPVPWLILPCVLAVWVLWRRQVGDAVRLAAITVVASGLGVLAVSRTIGPVYSYRLRWTWLLGMVGMVLVGWALWVVVSRASWPVPTGVLLVPVAAAIAALAVVNTVSAVRTSTPDQPESVTLAKLIPPVLKALPNRTGAVIVQEFGTIYYGAAIMLWLERDGIAARTVGIDAAQRVGERRVYHRGPIRAIVTIADDDTFDRLMRDPGQTLVAYQGSLRPQRRAALVARLQTLRQQYQAGQITKEALYFGSVPLLHQLGHAIGVFLNPR